TAELSLTLPAPNSQLLTPNSHLQSLRFLDGAFDAADEEEGLLGQVVVLAIDDLAEAAHRLLAGNVLAGGVGEHLGDEHRLREEPLDLAGARNDQLVLVGQLVDAQDGDDVLQLLVALED